MLSATALVIPIVCTFPLQLILTASSYCFTCVFDAAVQLLWIACADERTQAAVGQCWSSFHAPTAILSIVLVPTYVYIATILSLSYVDHTLQRPSYGSKLHGRGDVAILLSQVVVISLVSLLPSDDRPSLWVKFVALAAMAAAWLNAYMAWQPHVLGAMNDLRSALGGGFAWSVVCAFVTLTSPQSDVSPLLLGGFLPAAISAAILARLRRLRVEQLPLDKLQSVTDAHRWAIARLELYTLVSDGHLSPDLQIAGDLLLQRSVLKRAVLLNSKTASSLPGDNSSLSPAAGSAPPRSQSHSNDETSLLRKVSQQRMETAEMPEVVDRTRIHSLLRESAPNRSDRHVAVRFGKHQTEHHKQDMEVAVALQSVLLLQAEAAFQSATNQNGSLALAHFVQALFYRNFRDSRYTEFVALRAAKSSAPGFDVAFFVYQRHRQLNEAKANTNSSGEASLSAIDRLLYEQHSRDAADAGLEWSIGQARLWSALSEPVFAVDELHRHAVSLSLALVKADTAYNAMRKLNPNSSGLLRAVGQYMVTMRGDMEAGELLLAQADRIEQVAMQRSQQVVKRFVYGQVATQTATSIDETSASVTISGSRHTLGQIVDANAVASQVFRCSRSALLSKRLPDLFPRMLSQAMDAALYEYTSTGQGIEFNVPVLRIVLSSAGALVPVMAQFSETPDVDNSDIVNFQLSLQAVRLPHEIALVEGAAHNYRILGLTSGGASALGVLDMSADDAADGSGGSMLRYIPELDIPLAFELFSEATVRDSLATLNQQFDDGSTAQVARTSEDVFSFGPSSMAAGTPLHVKRVVSNDTAIFDPSRRPLPSSSLAEDSLRRRVLVTDLKRNAYALKQAARRRRKSRAATAASPNLTGYLTTLRLQPLRETFLPRDVLLLSWQSYRPVDATSPNPAGHFLGTGSAEHMSASDSAPRSASGDSRGHATTHVPASASPTGSQDFGSRFCRMANSQAYMEIEGTMPLMKTRAVSTDSYTGTVLSRATSGDIPSKAASSVEQAAKDYRLQVSVGSGSVMDNPLGETNVRFQSGSTGGGVLARFSSTEMGGAEPRASSRNMDLQGIDQVAASVATSSFSNSAKVRLGLLGIVAKESHPAAVRIVHALWLLCVVALVLAITQMVAVQSNLESSQRRIGTVLTNQLRIDLVSHAGVTVQSVIVSLETGQSILTPQQGSDVLLKIADDLEAATNRIIRDFDILSGDDSTKLEASKVTVGEFSPVGSILPIELSLTDACLWYVSHVRRAAPQIAAFNLQHPSVFTVLQAGQLVLRGALDASGNERISLYSDFVTQQQSERVVEFSIVFSILVWVTAAFVVWQMFRLDAHRQRILGVMKHVPRAQASGMKQLTSSNLLRRANDTGGDGLDGDANLPAELDDSAAGPTGLQPQRQNAPATGRKWNTSLRFKCSNSLLLCTPVLIVGCMLLSVFFSREAFRVRSEQAAQTALFAHELRSIMFFFATFTSGIASPSIVQQLAATSTTSELSSTFQILQTSLLGTLDEVIKGSNDGPLTGVTTSPLERGKDFTNLMLGDACDGFEPYVGGFGTAGECRSRSNGILKEAGLQGGILELVSVGGRGFNTFVQRLSPNTTLSPAVLAAATTDVVESIQLVMPHVSSISRSAAILKEDELLQLSREESRVLIACYVLYVLVLWGSVWLYFAPRARDLGRSVTASQVVLPMLPQAWVENMPDLRRRVEEATQAIILGTPDRAAAKRGRLVQALSGSA